jgi:hypothetical protein
MDRRLTRTGVPVSRSPLEEGFLFDADVGMVLFLLAWCC